MSGKLCTGPPLGGEFFLADDWLVHSTWSAGKHTAEGAQLATQSATASDEGVGSRDQEIDRLLVAANREKKAVLSRVELGWRTRQDSNL